MRANAGIVAGIACALLVMPAIADAQSTGPAPPQQLDTISSSGVSFKTGAFSATYDDLSIGDDDTGLKLTRAYDSSLNDVFSFSTGWATNLNMKVTASVVPPISDINPPPPQNQKWLYSVVIGGRSVGFYGGSTNPTGGPVGSYTPVLPGPQSLIFTGTSTSGHYSFVDGDGTQIEFLPVSSGNRANYLIKPDGTRLDFTYDANGQLISVASSSGVGVILERTTNGISKACVVNLGQTFSGATTCPAGVPTAIYGYTISSSGRPLLTDVTQPDGSTFRYEYGSYDHLTCVRRPAAGPCRLTNSYNVCVRKAGLSSDPPGLHLSDQVINQSLADGETLSYSFQANPVCPLDPYTNNRTTTVTFGDGRTKVVTVGASGITTQVVDELARTTSASLSLFNVLYARVNGMTRPENDAVAYTYDSFGNITGQTTHAKPGTGLADLIVSATYDCSNIKACIKPMSVTDARGSVTNFTYDSSHGGVLSEMGPAPAAGAARPLKLYTYIQKYAYVLNSLGSLVPAVSPIWMRASETVCQTVSGSSVTTCDAGAPRLQTAYEYGADGTVSNLLVRGVVATDLVTGTSRRTCYGYDAQGNKISETKPRANPTVCL